MPLLLTIANNYWKPFGVIILVAIYSVYVWNAGAAHEHGKWASREAAIRSEEQVLCSRAQTLTKEANDALQKDRDTLARRVAALKLQSPRCVPISRTSNIR